MADICPTCGSKTKNIRSPEQHRRYFGVIRAYILTLTDEGIADFNWAKASCRAAESKIKKTYPMLSGMLEAAE
jgi:hypothetical protein